MGVTLFILMFFIIITCFLFFLMLQLDVNSKRRPQATKRKAKRTCVDGLVNNPILYNAFGIPVFSLQFDNILHFIRQQVLIGLWCLVSKYLMFSLILKVSPSVPSVHANTWVINSGTCRMIQEKRMATIKTEKVMKWPRETLLERRGDVITLQRARWLTSPASV